jgi:hypothetical protein
MKIKDLLVELEQTPFGSVGDNAPPKAMSGDSAAWARAFKKIDSGGAPSNDYEWAVKLKLGGFPPQQVYSNTGKVVDGSAFSRKGYNGDPENVNQLLRTAPSISDLEKLIRDREVTGSQQSQSDVVANLQHELNIQQLIQQSQLDKVDIQAMLQMDVAARQAIRQKQQDMQLEAKERLAQIEIDIRKSKEGEQQREFELEKAKTNHAREIEVIRLTAEGEYKKAKLEADYQLHIKQLENIDNAEERKSKLDVINTEKQKELATIDAQTNAKVTELSAETDAKRAESDIRIHEEFMMKFKDAWGNMITKASETGKTLGQNISAVIGALGRLSKPVMPKSQQPAESIAYFRDLIAEMDSPLDTPVSGDKEMSREEWDAKFKNNPEVKIVNPLRMMPKDGSYFMLAMQGDQAVSASKGSMLGRSALGPETHVEFAAPKSVDQVLKDFNLEKFGPKASTPSAAPPVNPAMGRLRNDSAPQKPAQSPEAGRVLRQPMALRK